MTSPAGQLAPQVPFKHTAPAPQALPHALQLSVLDWRFTQSPSQRVCVAGQPVVEHLPPTHGSPDGHAVPHAPQLFGLVRRS